MNLYNDASLIITPNGKKAGKLYALKGDDLNVVRATSATRVNASGLIETVGANVPRLDYSNGTCPSILVEPQRTNLLTYSSYFDTNLPWQPYGSAIITANNAISPDGTMNADKVSVDGLYNTQLSFGANTTYSFSIFIKKDTATSFSIGYVDTSSPFTGGSISYNFATEVITATQSPNSSVLGTAKNYGNGWIRLMLKFTSSSFSNYSYIETNYIGGSGWIYGAQFEAGSYATSYIPTTSASVTRNADVISKTGISSLIGQTEGTIFMDLVINNLDLETGVFGIQKISTNSTIRIGSGAGGAQNLFAQCFNGSSNLFFKDTPYTLGSRVKIAFAYKAGSYAFYINGVQIATGTNATTIPTCDDFFFAKNFALGNNTAAKINSTLLYKTRLTNSELAQLTTI